MVFFWFCGNVVKIYYNYYNETPLQLILGGYIQVFFNIILIGQLIYYYRKNVQENENAKKGTEKKVLDGQNNDISESHISIVRKSEVNENDENETDFLVGNKNNGEVKEEVELSKDNKTDSGEQSGDEEENENEKENEIILKNKDNVENGDEEEQGRQELIIDLEDNKKLINNCGNKDNILVDYHNNEQKEVD
jgi:hypothetical protein